MPRGIGYFKKEHKIKQDDGFYGHMVAPKTKKVKVSNQINRKRLKPLEAQS